VLSAIFSFGWPDWTELKPFTDLDQIDTLDLAFASVGFEFPTEIRFPTLPVRTNNGIIFPRKGRSICGAPELLLAKRLGAKLNLRRGILVPTDRKMLIFKGFIQQSIEKRNEHKKGTFDNLFWKEVGNSTYGKTAQGLRKRRVYDLIPTSIN
jgi:hypothetical protein